MFKIIDRYIFKSLGGPFLFGVFSFFIIMSIDPLYETMHYILSQKKEVSDVLKWYSYKMLSSDLIFVFPMSVLLSTLITMGKFSRLSEVVAMKAGGISFFRIIRPVIFFAILVSIMTFFVYEKVIPNAIEQETLYKKYKLQNIPHTIVKDNVFLREDVDRFLSIKRVNFRTRQFKFLMVYYFKNNKLVKTLGSRHGKVKEDQVWDLKDGTINYFDETGTIEKVERFGQRDITLNNTLSEIENFDKEDPNAMSFVDLYKKIKSLSRHGVLDLNKYLVALYSKTAMPFSCLIFAVIGASMGTTSKRTGTFTNLGLSVIMIFIYYVITSFVKSYGVAGKIEPILASWLPNFIFFAFGAFLVTKVKN